jgi:hypothetical protein
MMEADASRGTIVEVRHLQVVCIYVSMYVNAHVESCFLNHIVGTMLKEVAAERLLMVHGAALQMGCFNQQLLRRHNATTALPAIQCTTSSATALVATAPAKKSTAAASHRASMLTAEAREHWHSHCMCCNQKLCTGEARGGMQPKGLRLTGGSTCLPCQAPASRIMLAEVH